MKPAWRLQWRTAAALCAGQRVFRVSFLRSTFLPGGGRRGASLGGVEICLPMNQYEVKLLSRWPQHHSGGMAKSLSCVTVSPGPPCRGLRRRSCTGCSFQIVPQTGSMSPV